MVKDRIHNSVEQTIFRLEILVPACRYDRDRTSPCRHDGKSVCVRRSKVGGGERKRVVRNRGRSDGG